MPVMDGYTATRTIREDDRFADLPILAMTADAMGGAQEKCLEVGMNDYIAKPLRRKKLIEMVEKWIPQHPTPDLNQVDTNMNFSP